MSKKTDERLNKLVQLLVHFEKTNREIDKTAIAKALGISRSALYKKGSKYREVLVEYGAFEKNKNQDIAPKELLLERIQKKDIEISKLHKKIEQLSTKHAKLEHDYKMVLEKHAHEESHSKRIQKFYEELIRKYGAVTGVNIEPFDLHDFTSIPLNIKGNTLKITKSPSLWPLK